MADSQRKPQHAPTKVVDDPELVKRERVFLAGGFFAAIAIVAGMLLLAGFLSNSNDGNILVNPSFLTFAIAGGIGMFFLGWNWILTRRAKA